MAMSLNASGNTSEWGWPLALSYSKCGGEIFFLINDALSVLGLQEYRIKRGLKGLAAILTKNDMTMFKRGKTIYFSKSPSTDLSKGMVIDLTPRKQHVNVAVKSNERPALVPVNKVKKPPPLPLKGKVFVISGNISERGDRRKMTSSDLKEMIEKNGGSVFEGNLQSAIDASFILVTSQKELKKAPGKLAKAVVMAYRIKWPIISKGFVITADATTTLPSIEDFQLDLTLLDEAQASSSLGTKVPSVAKRIDTIKTVSAHRELKNKLRNKRTKRSKAVSSRDPQLVKKPKKPCTAYVMFSRSVYQTVRNVNPNLKMSQINSKIAEMWACTNETEKARFAEKARNDFKLKQEQWNKYQNSRST